jgi:hypothetical protein
MNRRQKELLSRVLASRHFANAESLRRILQYLCHDVTGNEGPPLKEHEIAVRALGRPESFDPKTDPIVRVSIAAVRERLRSYFDSAREPLCLSIPKGQYRAVFADVEPPAEAAGEPQRAALRQFWSPYLGSARPNMLVIGELLFLRDANGSFFRNIYVNDVATAKAELQKRIPQIDVSSLRPSFHFYSAGEVNCMLSLIRLFHELKAPLEVRNARFCSWQELRDSNVILIGSPRVNKFVGPLQGDDCFAVLSDHIENRTPASGEQPSYCGRRYMDGQLERLVEYSVVTRKPGVAPGTFLTILSGHHGRVMEATAGFLTLEDKVRALFGRMQLHPSDPPPAHFQALLCVNMIDFDEEVVSTEYVTHRILGR